MKGSNVSKKLKDYEVHKYYDNIIDKISDAVFTFDENTIITSWNKAAERLYGWTAAEIIGKNFAEMVKTTTQPEERRNYLKQADTIGEVLAEVVHFTKANKKINIEAHFISIKDKSGNITGYLSVNRDITKRKQAEEELKNITQQLKFHTENTPLAVIEFNNQFQITKWSDNAAKIFGWEAAEVLGKKIGEFPWVYKEDVEIVDSLSNEMITGSKDSNISTNRNYRKDGSVITCEWYNSALVDSDGKLISVQSLIQDVTEQKKNEIALRENEERFRTLADNISQFTWMTDETGYIFWYNKRWYDYTGTTFDEMQGWGWKTVHHPDHIDRVMEKWTSALKAGKYWEDIFPLKSKDGEYGWFLSRAYPIYDSNGKILRWFGTNTDITDRMRAENELMEAYKIIEERYKEKEVLLRELYHRTKNNMQVVYSLLGLKSAKIEDKATVDILTDIGNRIKAIALVHEKLYQSKNLSRIDLKDYITGLAQLLVETYNLSERKIDLILHLESLNVLIDTAIPCGQIIIELLTNTFKHAFPGISEGRVSISLSKNANNLIELTVSDNGIGIPGYSDETGEDTLGMKLFRNLVEDQLQGDISYNMKNGVSWTIRFYDVLYDERV